MNPELIPEQELMKWAQVKSRRELVELLKREGIHYIQRGERGPVSTTVTWVNRAADHDDGPVEFG